MMPADATGVDVCQGDAAAGLAGLASGRLAQPTEVQAIQVGPAVLLSSPGRVILARVRSRYPGGQQVPVDVSGALLRWPTTASAMRRPEEAPEPDPGGGYETRLTFYSNLVAGGGPARLPTRLIELCRDDFTPGARDSHCRRRRRDQGRDVVVRRRAASELD